MSIIKPPFLGRSVMKEIEASFIRQTGRPVWWSQSHEKALSCLTRTWQPLSDLLAQGNGALVFGELELAGYAERRLEPAKRQNPLPSDHVLYRKASGL